MLTLGSWTTNRLNLCFSRKENNMENDIRQKLEQMTHADLIEGYERVREWLLECIMLDEQEIQEADEVFANT